MDRQVYYELHFNGRREQFRSMLGERGYRLNNSQIITSDTRENVGTLNTYASGRNELIIPRDLETESSHIKKRRLELKGFVKKFKRTML